MESSENVTVFGAETENTILSRQTFSETAALLIERKIAGEMVTSSLEKLVYAETGTLYH